MQIVGFFVIFVRPTMMKALLYSGAPSSLTENEVSSLEKMLLVFHGRRIDSSCVVKLTHGSI